MKHFFCFVVIFLLAETAFPQTYVAMVKNGGYWGFVNIKGEMIIPARYDRCNSFSSNGLAPVFEPKNNLYYFINLKGEKLKTQFQNFTLMDPYEVNLRGFSNGKAAVKIGNKWGYLGTDGKLVTPISFDEASEFSNGYGVAKRDKQFVIIDDQGKITPVDDSKIVLVERFSEGLAPFSEEKLSGFIGPDGKVVVAAKFENVGNFHAGLAWARTTDGKIGYLDRQGEWTIKPEFDVAKDFDVESGMARVKRKGAWVYVNRKNEELVMKDTEYFGDFSEGLAHGRKSGRDGFFNNKGAWAIAPTYQAVQDFKNGFAVAKYSGKWGIISKDGAWVIQPTFGAIKDMELVTDH